MAVKCKINSRAQVEPDTDGQCPECLTPDVPVTKKGFVGAHTIKLNLGEGPTVPVTDSGSPIGDPRDAMVRREVEAIHVKTGTRPADRDASVAEPVETTGHGRAPVLVRGRDMPPVQPTSGYLAAAGTLAGSLGRERSEREAMHGGMYGYLTTPQYNALSRTQQRKYWARLKKDRDQCTKIRATRVRIAATRFGTGGVGAHGFTDDQASRHIETLMREVPHA